MLPKQSRQSKADENQNQSPNPMNEEDVSCILTRCSNADKVQSGILYVHVLDKRFHPFEAPN